MDIVIAGGGIGGLAAALALHADGHRVRVYEAVPQLKQLGVGINLLPHAARILDDLGVLDRLLERGVATRELAYYTRHGQRIWAEGRGLWGGFTAPQISLSRGALHWTLLEFALERLGEDRVVTGARLEGFDTVQNRAVGRFVRPDGSTFETTADIMICADGIHSAARKQMYPHEGLPKYAGRVLWRATSFAQPYLTGASMIMAGYQSQKFVCYPIEAPREDGLQRINWIAELDVPELLDREDWNRPGDVADFGPQFDDWRFDWLDIPQLIATAESIYEYPLVDRDPVESWTQGRVTLLGDAGHPMYPIGSNGASQAVLDAEAIARALKTHANEPVSALHAYDEERRTATGRIVLMNRQNGPEQCMQLAHERAPQGFERLEDIFADGELQEIADRYKQVTGMKKAMTGQPA